MNGKELARTVSDAVNNMSFDTKAFCETMEREHRTLQQSFTRLCFAWIKHCSEMQNFDARNEASVMSCRKIQEFIETEDIELPFI